MVDALQQTPGWRLSSGTSTRRRNSSLRLVKLRKVRRGMIFVGAAKKFDPCLVFKSWA